MVWYQKFEYALGHWMQKATEHVFGKMVHGHATLLMHT